MRLNATRLDPNTSPVSPTRHSVLPTAWRRVLLAGFVVQLLLILFVTAIGLQRLQTAAHNLDTVVDIHMRKLSLTKTMMTAARERTLCMFRMSINHDPFERDRLFMEFNDYGATFVGSRLALLGLPLGPREHALLDRQGQLAGIARPMQYEIIQALHDDFEWTADERTLSRVTLAQDDVLAALSQLDAETRQRAQEASQKAHQAQKVARFWMYLLSAIAVLLSVLVAAAVIHYASRASRERQHLATHDALTALPNRMLFMDHLEQFLMRAQRSHTLVGVMFIDLDRFKRVNDTLGHTSGDMLIREVAQRLGQVTRTEDVVARLGGDEFGVIIDVARIGHVLRVVEKILAAIGKPYQIAGRELFSSCSIGISVYPHDSLDSASLLQHAATAASTAKNSGRNRFQLYDAAMNSLAEERLQLETELHYALERDEFLFHYQPKLNLESGHIQGVEALLRWNHPDRGLLGPAAFLELLEENGGIVKIGRTLLRSACGQMARWHTAGFTGLDVAVNLSGKEFWHEGLLANIRDALQQSGLPPHALHLELTESIFMQDVEAAVAIIQALKALGVAVAIDDFGTGYSSLAHLKRFPIDILKIDRFFVKDIPHSTVNEALIGSVLALARGLGLGTVAEGIETREQLDILRKLGCQVVQGYFISQPVPAEAITALLDRDWLKEFEAV